MAIKFLSGLNTLVLSSMLKTDSSGVIVAATAGTDYISGSGYNNTNWNTAYGWGDHSVAGYTSSAGTLTGVTATLPVRSSGGTTPDISMAAASTSVDGYLTSTDWNTFNSKTSNSGTVTGVTATSPVISSGGTAPVVSMPAASGTVSGYLTSANWTTFNNKTSNTGTTTASNTQTFTNKSGAVSQWDNDSGYVTTDTNTQLSTAQVRAMISASGNSAYNATTGVITSTDTNTWRGLGTTASVGTAGNDARLSDARTPLTHTHSYLPLAGGTLTGGLTGTTAVFSGSLNASGGLYFVGDTNMGFVPYPIGGQFRSDSSSHTGYIKISLPTAIGNSPDDMISFYVDIYDYTTNEMISVFVGGYNYRTTSTSVYWYNCTAIINTKQSAKDFKVRFGNDGTNFYIAIGETSSVWTHPSIVVRDFQCSYRGNVVHYIDGWSVGITAATLSGVDETQTGNLPAASSVTNFSGTSSGTNTGDQTTVSGNAGTVTNGVYTTGNQTIGGTKTFDVVPVVGTAAAANNSTSAASTAYVTTAVTNLIGGAPGALDTLNELAAAIDDDASYAATITAALGGKAATSHTHSYLPLAGGTVTGLFSTTGGSKIEIQNATDGGSSRGIFLWTSTDTNWGIYMGTSGASKSLSGGTATAGVNGDTSHQVRFRAASGVGNGFTWESSAEVALMSLSANTGKLYTKDAIYPSGSSTVYVSDQRISNWNTAHGWGDHASGGYAASSHTHSYLPLAGGTMTGNIVLNDGVKASFGSGSDLNIYHNGTNGIVQNLTGGLYFIASAGETLASFIYNGATSLFYDNVNKLETTSAGVTVAGVVTATGGNSTTWNTHTSNTGTTTASNTQTFTNKDGAISQWDNDSGYVTSSGNTIIGTDADVNTSGAQVIDVISLTDGVVVSAITTRNLTPANIGAARSDVSTAASTWNSAAASQHEFSGWDANGASWTPTTDWYWGMTLPHVSNSTSYNYSAQFAVRNASAAETYVRTIGGGTANPWKQVWTSNNFANNSTDWNTAYGWGNHGLSAQDKTDIGNLSGTNTGDQTSVSGSSGSTTGNALTATRLQTSRNINGVAFNGSANITVADATKLPLAGGVMTGDLELGTYATTATAVLKLNGSTANKQSVLKTTNGNLHIDAASGHNIYLNWYGGTGGTLFGNGAGASGASVSAGGVYTATGGNSTNWNSAYGWGDHASGGYQASGNYFTDGDTVLNMANNDGLVYNDTNNLMYIKADGTDYAIIDSRGGTMGGVLNMNGQTLSMVNGSITAINSLTFNDPGVNEGVKWNGGNLWQIYESPDAQTNAAGNLQFVQNATRRLTIDTSGNVQIVSGELNLTAGDFNLTKRTLTDFGGVRTYENVAQYYNANTTNTGTVVIKIGSTPNVMIDAEIVVQGYGKLAKYHIRGYTHLSASGWHQPTATAMTSNATSSVRFGVETSTGDRVILIGTTGTSLGSYPHVTVPRVSRGYSSGAIGTWSISIVTSEAAYSSIATPAINDGFTSNSPQFTGTPVAPTAAANTNTTQVATTAYVQTEITGLIGGAPAALDTLNELAAAINDDASYASTLTTALATKLPLVGGTISAAKSGTPLLTLHNLTNGGGAIINFSDQAASPTQFGNLKYFHADGSSYGSGNAFVLTGTEASMTILADGKLMYRDGIYSKPSTGTGAGTRKDANWDTAYGWGNHASGGYAASAHSHSYLPLGGGTLTGNLIMSGGSVFEMASSTGFEMKFTGTTGASNIFAESTNLFVLAGTGKSLRMGSNNVNTELDLYDGNLTCKTNINPDATTTYDLGSDALRWWNIYCETLDSAGLHEKNLANKEVSELPTGTVLVWINGKAVPSINYADYMKIGIAVEGSTSPLVHGAEPVLCVGEVNEGDYLVSSNKEGHAVALTRQAVRDGELQDCVIGKALAAGNGDSHLVKTWLTI